MLTKIKGDKMEYSNENRGAVWKNDKKETEKHPDFTGSLNVGGTDYWVSAWKRKEGANDKAPALSFSIKLKDNVPKPAARKPAAIDPFDEDIAF